MSHLMYSYHMLFSSTCWLANGGMVYLRNQICYLHKTQGICYLYEKHILKSENVCERPGFPLKWGVPLLDMPSSKSTVECFLIKNIRHKGRSDIILCYQFYFDYFYLLFLCGADFMGITFWTYFSVHPWIQVTFLSKGF